MLLFSGGGPASRVPEKQYRAFFSFKFEFDPDERHPCDVILVHSLGIIKALLYCQKFNIVPRGIVAMDTVDVSEDHIRSQLHDRKPDGKELYEEFLRLRPPIPCPMAG